MRARSEAKFAAQQLGFIQAIVQPLLQALCTHFPALRPRLVPRLERTISYWLQVQATPKQTSNAAKAAGAGSAPKASSSAAPHGARN